MKRVLVTGACGFLGRNVSTYFKKKGFEVLGLGYGHWGDEQPEEHGIDKWVDGDVCTTNLLKITKKLDCIVHCAGGSSVGDSVVAPLEEFEKTVNSASNILEYARVSQTEAKLVFPSSAAVYGEKDDAPIQESDSLTPVSPYGFYKKMTEELCESYCRNFNLSVSVIRFFSIHGNGLKKQLLWDACTKLSAGDKEVAFFGTGRETRDWLHIEDAVALIYVMSQTGERYTIVNGGSGKRSTVLDILLQLKKILGIPAEIVMNGSQKVGDPLHYWADIQRLRQWDWCSQKSLENGLEEYVSWFLENKKKMA